MFVTLRVALLILPLIEILSCPLSLAFRDSTCILDLMFRLMVLATNIEVCAPASCGYRQGKTF